jgi:hypothetical protein
MELLDNETFKTYTEHKSKAMDKDFDPIAGVNSLVWDESHNFKNDLQTQKKRMAYPSMFQTCSDFNRLVVPAGEYVKNQRYSYHNSPDVVQPRESIDTPAGMRIPLPFKQNLGEKVPIIV